MRVTRYIHQHHIGLVALFIALTGTAYAGTQVANISSHPPAAKAKKKVKRGPQGPAGPAGAKGPAGPAGSSAPGFFVGRSTFSDSGHDSYATPVGSSALGVTAADAEVVSPAGGPIVARDLYVNEPTPTGRGFILNFTLAVNGVDSALQCTIDEHTTLECSDTTHTVVIPPMSTIVLHHSHGTGGGAGIQYPFRFGWRATSP